MASGVKSGITIPMDREPQGLSQGQAQERARAQAQEEGWGRAAWVYWPPAWLAALNAHWDRHHRDLPAARGRASWRPWERALFALPFGFYAALGLRWARERLSPRPRRVPLPVAAALGSEAEADPEGCPHCGPRCVESLILNERYPYLFARDLLRPLARRYFRAEFHGLHRIPQEGPTLVYMNHAGMAFPWDFLVLGGELMLRWGGRVWLRGPGEKVFTRNPIFNFILPRCWLETVGGVEATFLNLERLYRHRSLMLYAPEGAAGMAKGWHRRYRLQRFHTSFLKLAAKYKARLVPAVCLGGEGLHPFSVNVPMLARLLGFPFFGISPFVPLLLPFPSLLVWSLPVKLRYFVFDPVELPPADYGRFTEEDWRALAEEFRQDLQGRVDRLLRAGDSRAVSKAGGRRL